MASLPGMPWPELIAIARQALAALPASSTPMPEVAWTFPSGPLRLDGASLCLDGQDCGEGGAGWPGELRLRLAVASARLQLRTAAATPRAGHFYTFSLTGRSGDGMKVQGNCKTCTHQAAGQACGE